MIKTIDETMQLVGAYLKQKGVEVTSLKEGENALTIDCYVGPTSGREINQRKENIKRVVSKLLIIAVQSGLKVESTDFFPLTTPKTEGKERTEQQLSREAEHYAFRIPLKVLELPSVLAELTRVASLEKPLISSTSFFSKPRVTAPPSPAPSAKQDLTSLYGSGPPGGLPLDDAPQAAKSATKSRVADKETAPVMGSTATIFGRLSNTPNVQAAVRPESIEASVKVDTTDTKLTSAEQNTTDRPSISIRHG